MLDAQAQTALLRGFGFSEALSVLHCELGDRPGYAHAPTRARTYVLVAERSILGNVSMFRGYLHQGGLGMAASFVQAQELVQLEMPVHLSSMQCYPRCKAGYVHMYICVGHAV